MSLNVIGLISGGKDSLFSLAHCVQNGHKLVALANLYPNSPSALDDQVEDGEGPDLDSFMYQTVGYSVVSLYEEALGIPLYRRCITGTAVQRGRYYETSSVVELADETEDMYALVKEILQSHPEVNALSAGAILSTYQRTRVESVAVRLGLVPLAYLWQYPALPPPSSRTDSLTGLLDDMGLSNCDARIIKIASGGIQADVSFSSVTNPSTKTKLISGMTPFFIDAGQEFWLRGAVLGEGGEYETLVLDGPSLMWKKKIRIDTHETYEAEGGAIYVRLGKACLVERDEVQTNSVPTPVLLDERFAAVQSKVLASSVTDTVTVKSAPALIANIAFANRINVKSNFNKSSNTVQVFNLTSPGSTAAEQLDIIITTLPIVLGTIASTYNIPESCLTARSIVSTVLLLRSMEDFASVNQVYATKLWPQGYSNPPARVTVAASLPRAAKVSISLVYDVSAKDARLRKGLHVQSRSYWAPANIGPYSQAICVPIFGDIVTETGGTSAGEIVHLAGQIPLLSSTMSMLGESFIAQTVLALQHLWRVGQERDVDRWAGAGIAFLARNGSNVQDDLIMFQRAREAARIWKLAHRLDEKGLDTYGERSSASGRATTDEVEDEEDEDIDVWDLQQRRTGFASMTQRMTVGEHLHKLPNRTIDSKDYSQTRKTMKPVSEVPCFIAAEVLDLPRNAPVEWWSTGIAGLITTAGTQTMRTSSVPTVSKRSWTLSGVSVKEIKHGRFYHVEESFADVDAGSALASKQQTTCFFVTLLINSGIVGEDMQTLPHDLQDLVPYLVGDLEGKDALQWELGIAQSFVNFNCPVITPIFEELQLLRDSCVILCNRVWASETYREESLNSYADGDFPTNRVNQISEGESSPQAIDESKDDIKEVAAAVVMRIDAVTKS